MRIKTTTGRQGLATSRWGVKRELFYEPADGIDSVCAGRLPVADGRQQAWVWSGDGAVRAVCRVRSAVQRQYVCADGVGADLPFDTSVAPNNMFWRATVGQAIGQDHMLGRLWSPMVEFLASRNFAPGEKTNWDVLPEMQVTVSRRQHVRVGFGVREPFTNTSGRTPQVLFYLLWDRADGSYGTVGDEDFFG